MRFNAPRMNGKVAATLMAKAGELLAKAPAIHKIEILADKLPRSDSLASRRSETDLWLLVRMYPDVKLDLALHRQFDHVHGRRVSPLTPVRGGKSALIRALPEQPSEFNSSPWEKD